MSIIIENYAKVRGVVKSVKVNPKLSGYHQIHLDLIDIESFPNLAKADEGKVIKVNIPSTDIEKKPLKKDQKLALVVRKERGQVYFIR
jgi:hypothetical protein